MKSNFKITLLFFSILSLSRCGVGTLSNLRPADTLEQNQIEVAAGVTGYPRYFPLITMPIFKLDYGLTRQLEVNFQIETFLFQTGLRWGLMNSKDHPFAISLGLNAGIIDDTTRPIFAPCGHHHNNFKNTFVWGPQVIIGKKLSDFEPYLSYKAFISPHQVFQAASLKLGTRYNLSQFSLTAEAGYSQFLQSNKSYLYQPEMALGFAMNFSDVFY